jgi:nucleoid-associated protein YgaU
MKNLMLTSALVILTIVLVAGTLPAQDKMKYEDWQARVAEVQGKITSLTADRDKLNADITSLKSESDKLDQDVRACEDALYAMLGVTRADVEAFDKELTDMENRVAELQRMSDAELVTHKDELVKISDRLKEMAKSKIALIPRYNDRLTSLQDKVNTLLNSLQKEKTYTVGTWGRNHDCLWNIAKKKDIYANAWLWPKIWQGNRDKIKDPDVIKPKMVLKIPEGSTLTKEEKSAANRYYRKKTAAEPAASPK